jgi:hypothetical protein
MTFAELIAAAEAGAASIYHDIIAAGQMIAAWESSPVIAPLVATGVSLANDMLTRVGANGSVITSDVTSALKLIAAKDPTVTSGSGAIGALVGLAGSIATALVPGAAIAIAAAEGGVSLIEDLIGAGATITKSTTLAAAPAV